MAAHPVSDRIVIQVDGVFDVPAARRLAETLGELGLAAREVHVDLTRVREFHDFGVALLARALAGRRGVTVAGLRHHQLRLLRYLGIDPGGDGAVPGAASGPA